LPPQIPAALVIHATRPDEHVVRRTIGTIMDGLDALPSGPAILIVGNALKTKSALSDLPSVVAHAAEA
jgi:siroheme synthase